MEEREFINWEKAYREDDIKKMPWYYEGLDPDLEAALAELGVSSGRALDIGSGPGTQAIALAEMGFNATGTDLSASAVKVAKKFAREKGASAEFIEDDILSSKLEGSFDVILDRGCFHVLSPARRSDYVKIIDGLLNSGGHLFLKCFSVKEKMSGGPYRFDEEGIKEVFSATFKINSINETVYYGTMRPMPVALFSVIAKKD